MAETKVQVDATTTHAQILQEEMNKATGVIPPKQTEDVAEEESKSYEAESDDEQAPPAKTTQK